MKDCKHDKIVWDDFISFETDEQGRCTKYLSLSHCSDCDHKFRKFFKLVDSKSRIRTYVIEKEEVSSGRPRKPNEEFLEDKLAPKKKRRYKSAYRKRYRER